MSHSLRIMGNCWIFKKCKWPLRTRDDAKYQFDPDKDIRIEPKRPEEMREVSNFYEDTFDIDLVERTSLENKNCTQIDDVLREIKDQKEMVNNNIKLEMKAKGADDDNNEINFGPEDLSFIGSTPLHDIVEEDEAIGSGLKSLNESSLSSMVNLDLEDLDNDKYLISLIFFQLLSTIAFSGSVSTMNLMSSKTHPTASWSWKTPFRWCPLTWT